jgi:hypothetical protein
MELRSKSRQWGSLLLRRKNLLPMLSLLIKILLQIRGWRVRHTAALLRRLLLVILSGTTTTFVQDLGAAQALLDQDPSQNFSEEEIENMMGVLTDPNWTWEVEPYPNRQQQMDDCSLAAMQTPCFFAPDDNNNSASSASASCITTTRTSPDHDYLQQTSQDQGIAEMVAEMTDADGQLDLVPPMAMMEQHVDQEPGMSNGSGYMDLLVQGLPNVATGTQGVLDSEGIDFLLLLASASAPSA